MESTAGGSQDVGEGGFGAALDGAISRSGLSLTEIQDRLAFAGHFVSLATLSYWRRGMRHPEGTRSLAAVAAVEQLLGCAVGELLGEVGGSRRHGRVPEDAAAWRALVDDPVAIARVHRALDADASHPAAFTESEHVTVLLDAERRIEQVTVRTRWRSRVDLARRVVLMLPAHASRLSQVEGARTGREHRDPESGLNGCELILPRPLRRRESTITEVRWRADDGSESGAFSLTALRRTVDTSLWVRFPEGAAPYAWRRRTRAAGPDAWVRVGVGESGIHHSRAGFGPGVLTVEWAWERLPPLNCEA